MQLENVIAIRKPDPDSHFRLRACEECGSDDVAYVLREDNEGEAWSAECFHCGHTGAKDPTRHGAQVQWNRTGSGALNWDIRMQKLKKELGL